MKSPVLAGLLALAAGCRTTETRSLASAPLPLARVGTRARTWEVHGSGGGELLGLVVLFQERGLARDSVYLVRNPWNQDLGLIDGLGRAYRYLPHSEEPAWVGTGTIALGAQRILGAASACELLEIDSTLGPGPGSVEASASPSDSAVADPLPASDLAPSTPRSPDEGLPQSR